MPRIALYPGSFDPPTNGHVAILRAALSVCDHLVIGVGTHAAKTPQLSADDRVRMLAEIAAPLANAARTTFEVRMFDTLVVTFAWDIGATLIVRGLRDGADLDYEMQMAGMNAEIAPGVQTVFLPALPETRHITATLVRQIAAMGGDVAPFVPPQVAAFMAGDRQRKPRA